MIDILVPVLGRPQNAAPVAQSIVENTKGPYRIIFICSPSDQEQLQACVSTAQNTWMVNWEPGPADFAKKINWAFGRTNSEWVFQGADDIRFSPGWDMEAFKVATRGRSVIGTNDLHNPAVKAGTHSTHLLFRRDYVEKYGGTFDHSGAVFSETYDHQFVDNEFIETAKLRNQWAFAKRAVVEHFHPVWGNNQWDPTYEKAFRATAADQALYVQRMQHVRVAVG